MKDIVYLNQVLKDKEKIFLVKEKLVSELKSESMLIVSLNIPGWPKVTDENSTFLYKCIDVLVKILPLTYITKMGNYAGEFFFFRSDLNTFLLKKHCVEIENRNTFFRLLDIDCINIGLKKYIDRKSIGEESRRCLLCNYSAEHCIVHSSHLSCELRYKADTIIKQFLDQI